MNRYLPGIFVIPVGLLDAHVSVPKTVVSDLIYDLRSGSPSFVDRLHLLLQEWRWMRWMMAGLGRNRTADVSFFGFKV